MHSTSKTFSSFAQFPAQKKSRFPMVMLAALLVGLTAVTGAFAASTFNLLDARERGTTPMGTAKGMMTATFDETAKKDVLELDYLIPQGATVSAWVRNFPAELASASVNTVKIGVKTLTAVQASEVSVAMEVRGSQGVQSIPVALKTGWSSIQEKLDWTKIGTLSEVIFKVSSKNTADAKGTLSFSLEFIQQAAAVKPVEAATVAAKVAQVQEAVAQAVPKISKGIAVDADMPVVPSIPQKASVAAPAPSLRSSFGLLDAGDKGVTPAGAAKGSVNFSFDEDAKKDVFDLGYTIAQGSSLNVWTRKFPADLTAAQVNTIDIGLRVLDAAQLRKIDIQAELTGTSGTQTIALGLKPGWNSFQKTVQWKTIGQLNEVSFKLVPKGSDASVSGTLYLGFDFCKTTFYGKYLTLIKFGSVFLLGLILALLGRLFVPRSGRDRSAVPGTSGTGKN